jgi:tetratricopeptide (TPR) repeat protein
LEDYGEVIRLTPNDSLAYYNRGAALYDKGDLDGALNDFNQAISLTPDFAAAYVSKGLAHQARWFKRGLSPEAQVDLAAALNDFNDAIRVNPDFAPAYFNRGNWHRIRGDLVHALNDYSEAIRLNPDDAVAHRSRAVPRPMGDLEGAEQDQKTAERIARKRRTVPVFFQGWSRTPRFGPRAARHGDRDMTIGTMSSCSVRVVQPARPPRLVGPTGNTRQDAMRPGSLPALADATHRPLAAPVGRGAGAAFHPRGGRDVDDVALALGLHERHHPIRDVDQTEDVRVEHLPHRSELERADLRAVRVAGVVDEHVDAAHALLAGVDRPGVVGLDGDVGVKTMRPGPALDHLDSLFVASSKHDLVSGPARQLDDGSADALAAAGDQKTLCLHLSISYLLSRRRNLVADLEIPPHRIGYMEALERTGHVRTRLALPFFVDVDDVAFFQLGPDPFGVEFSMPKLDMTDGGRAVRRFRRRTGGRCVAARRNSGAALPR